MDEPMDGRTNRLAGRKSDLDIKASQTFFVIDVFHIFDRELARDHYNCFFRFLPLRKFGLICLGMSSNVLYYPY